MKALRGLKQAKRRTTPLAKAKKVQSRPMVCKRRVIERTFNTKSETNPNKLYTVSYKQVSDRWEWSCNCPAFTFKKIDQVDCKHIRHIRTSPAFSNTLCDWKSSIGPEKQSTPRKCPRCGFTAVEEPTYEEDA